MVPAPAAGAPKGLGFGPRADGCPNADCPNAGFPNAGVAAGCAGWPNAGAPKGFGFAPSTLVWPKALVVCAGLPKGDVPPSAEGWPNEGCPKAGVPNGLGFWPKTEGWPKAEVAGAAGVAGAPKGFVCGAAVFWKAFVGPPGAPPAVDALQMSMRLGCLFAASTMNWMAAGMLLSACWICCCAFWYAAWMSFS